jgi:hypothetical protein
MQKICARWRGGSWIIWALIKIIKVGKRKYSAAGLELCHSDRVGDTPCIIQPLRALNGGVYSPIDAAEAG